MAKKSRQPPAAPARRAGRPTKRSASQRLTKPGGGRAPKPSKRFPSTRGPDFAIVGVGASAGGLEAFTALLRALPDDPGVAVVFVQHLAPQHESALVALLSGQSALPVVQVTEGMRVERNHVYVIPPNSQMEIAGHELHISPRPQDRTRYTPIDAFLVSLARTVGRRSIGVILSGTASDGALGLREIKAAGGIAIVQSPESAKHDGMPRAAIATGIVDLVLAPEEIGANLSHFAGHPVLALKRGPETAPPELEAVDAQLQAIFDLLRPASGVDFRHYKLPTIRRRVFRRMAMHRLSDIVEYIQLLRTDGAEVRSLSRDLLIHVTRFFREPESFEAIARQVFPAILEGRPRDQPIRVWVSGCATGEECYSLAIALVEFLAKQQSEIRVQIFATDVSEGAIEQARAGVYPQSIEADVSADRLRRFFTKSDGGYRVSKMIRDLCVFARQDLTKDPPFSRLDLILCRNVLIYMDLVLQKKLLSVFHYALTPAGFLVLGQAETVGAQATLFSLVNKKYRIHRKRPNANLPTMTFPVDFPHAVAATKKVPPEAPTAERVLQTEVNRVINERFAPPGVVIDSEMHIVQFRGQTGTFLAPAPGEASLNLLKMAKDGLLHGLRSAVHTARKSKAPVRRPGLQVRSDTGWVRVDLEVVPLASTGRVHYLVLFDQRSGRVAAPEAKPKRPTDRRGRRSQLSFLERELAASREYLQSVIQELEAANEDLQSANEEILSSNEELQSTNEELDTAKEELQSTNEELNTVNGELHGRNEELSRVNSDLLNLLGSVQIAIVIVGADMRIRRFTPMAEKVLNLIPGDIDRLIGHINPNIEGANLEELIAECIENIGIIEREVKDRQGRWYALRIRPYRSADNKIDGAVLALFDIDTPKRHEAAVRSATELAEAVLQSSMRPMALLTSDGRVRTANGRFAELLRLRGDGLQGQLLSDVVRFGGGFEQLQRSLREKEPPSGALLVEVKPTPDAGAVRLQARVFPVYDGTSHLLVLLTSTGDGETRGID